MACLARHSQEVWLLLSGSLFRAGTHHGASLKSNGLSAPRHSTPPQHWADTHRPKQTVKIMTIITSWGAGLSSHRFWREAHLTDGKTEDCCSGFLEDNWSTYSLQAGVLVKLPLLRL